MIIGPIFTREAVTTPRRIRLYFYRALYVSVLLGLMCTAWSILAGTQIVRNLGDMARFGSILFQILAPLQLALVAFFSAMSAASAVALEKDRRTLILLLMTRMSNSELVLGKLLASMLYVLVMLAAALPVFMLLMLLGGVSYQQVGCVFAVTLTTALAAGSLGSTLALWREKTFQTLSLTALSLVFWLGVWEAVGAGLLGSELAGISCASWATGLSPLRAIMAAARPSLVADPALGVVGNPVYLYLILSLAITAVLNLLAISRVRVWNPSREVRRGERSEEGSQQSIWGVEYDLVQEGTPADQSAAAEVARAGHVDAMLRQKTGPAEKSRRVWDNPILWREVCTWAYGRKVIAIRLAYWLLFFMAAGALYGSVASGEALPRAQPGTVIPAAAKPLASFFLVSLVIVNALAVTSITNERDGLALDMLLVTDLSPKEFVFGKLGGVLVVTREMVVLPMLLCVYLWWSEGLTLENLIFVIGCLLVMNVFVTMLGIHCGMTYANSRTAIGVSLGTVFFLFLGVVACMMLMISFSSSFQVQLAPFLAFIVGGGIGLYASLGARNPSPAIGLASLVVPFATFYAIVSFLLDKPGFVFLVTVSVYSFTTAAMMIPALYEFDVAMGRTTGENE